LTVSQFETDWNAVNADFTDKNGFYIISLFQSPSHPVSSSPSRFVALPLSVSLSAPVKGTAGRESGWSFLLPRFYPFGVFALVAISESRNKEQQTGNLTMLFSINISSPRDDLLPWMTGF
jgi:hypothetical protein